MNVATHLEIVSIFGRWARGQARIPALLSHALHIAQQQGIALTALHLYELDKTRQEFTISASTADNTTPPAAIPLAAIADDDESVYRQAQNGGTAFDATRRIWVSATHCTEASYPLIEWLLADDSEVSSFQQDWIELLSHEIGQALDLRTMHNTLSEQRAASAVQSASGAADGASPTMPTEFGEIIQSFASSFVETNLAVSQASSLSEMLDVIMKRMPPGVRMALAILFEYGELAPDEARPRLPASFHLEGVATQAMAGFPDAIYQVEAGLTEDHFPMLKPVLDGELAVFNAAPDTLPILGKFIPIIRQYAEDYAQFDQVIAMPLVTTSTPFGMLVLLTRQDLKFEGVVREILRALTVQLSVTVENRRLLQRTSNALKSVSTMYELSTVLHYARQPDEMLWVLFQTVMRQYTHAQLLIFDEDTGRSEIVGEVSGQEEALEVFPEHFDEEITVDMFGEEPVIILPSQQILMLPLRTADQRVIGLVRLINVERGVNIDINQLRALRSLADQMATGLQNAVLLQQTEKSLLEALTLYEMNAALLKAGDDTPSILGNIHEHLVLDADQILLFSIHYETDHPRITHFVLEATADRNERKRVNIDILSQLDQATCDYVLQTWQMRGDRIDFFEKPSPDPISALAARYYIEQGSGRQVSSSVVIPVLENGLVSHLLLVLYETPQRFQETAQRMYYTMRDQFSLILRNIELLQTSRQSSERLEQQLRILQLLNTLATQLNTIDDLQAMYDTACRTYYEALGVDHVGMTTLNPDGESATVVSDYPSQNLIGIQISGENELQERIRTSRNPIYIPSIQDSEDLAEISRQELTKLGLKSLIFIPMLDRENNYIGAIGLEYYEKQREFSKEMIELAHTITSQVVIGLQNMHQVVRIRRQAEQLQALAELSGELQTQLDMNTIIRLVAEGLSQVIVFDHLHILFYDTAAGMLRPAIERYLDKVIVSPGLKGAIPMEMSTAGMVWTQRKPVYIPVMEKEPSVQHLLRPDMQSVLGAPLQSRGQLQGVIEVSSRQNYAYSQTDQSIFQQFANILSAALENAEVYTQSQRIARSKALINDISSQIQRQTELEQILGVTMNELGRALGAKQARIRIGKSPDDQETQA